MHEAEARRSRFRAHAAPVRSPEEALAFVDANREPSAHHNCWAYRVGADYRSSDDGEPAGTSGRPILAAIDGQGLDRVVVVVARWFGGTKLGAGGLARAYGGTAAECLRRAPRRPIIASTRLVIACSFADGAAVHAALAQAGGVKLDETFDATGTRLHIRVPVDAADELRARVRDATRDRARIDDNG